MVETLADTSTTTVVLAVCLVVVVFAAKGVWCDWTGRSRAGREF